MKEYSFFDSIISASEDPILGLPLLVAKDPRPHKVNLGIGSYKTAEGRSLLLNSAIKAEEMLLSAQKPKDYLPIEGDPVFNEKMIELSFGAEAPRDRIICFQTIGGTQALRLGGEFLSKNLSSLLFISSPSWANHHLIFSHAGLTLETYPYYDRATESIDFENMKKSIEQMPPGSIILLQTACHNPTGASLNQDQWKIIGKILLEKRILPFLDNAYQGFGKSLEADAYPMRLFLKMGLEMFIACSCSKNFGLYGERVGALIFVANHKDSLAKVTSQLKKLVRSFCSTPPLHGGAIVREILNTPALKKEWEHEVDNMRNRVILMRSEFAMKLTQKSGKDYSYLNTEEGFFSLLNLREEQVLRLRSDHAVYMPLDGRVNIAGLTPSNIDYVVESILSL